MRFRKLFCEFTGVRYHIAWRARSATSREAWTLPTRYSAYCRRARAGLQPWEACRACGPSHLAATLKSDNGHRFVCSLGVRNYWLPIRVCDETPGIAYLQDLNRPAPRSSGRSSPARQARERLLRPEFRPLNQMGFDRASRLLQFGIHWAQTASLWDLREADLARARRPAGVAQAQPARLPEAFRCHSPPPAPVGGGDGTTSRSEQIVRQLREWMEQDYRKPITLKSGAGKLRMNAAYLSALFSRVAGVPFKTYLTRLRLEKAAELLSDRDQTATNVAAAVGYASEDRFRAAFKKATGFSPRLWRETIQMH